MNMRRYTVAPCVLAVALLATTSAIAQFQRIAVMEEFTSITCNPCTTATAYLNQLVAQYPDRFVTIRTQLNQPAPHTYWTAEGQARADHYAVGGIPAAALDGVNVAPQSSEIIARVEDRFDVESPVQIAVTQTRNGNVMNVQVVLTAGPFGLPSNQAIHVVAVQREFHDEAILQVPHNNGESTLHDMMRKLVNGVDGESVMLDPSETKTLNFSYDLDPGWDPNQMYTVVFVQDEFSNAVSQAGFSARPTSSVGPTPWSVGYMMRSPIPTPASTRTILPFTLGSASDVLLSIYAMDGSLVSRLDLGQRSAGDYAQEIDLAGVAPGVYSCVLDAGDVRMTKSVVVSR